jgi:hypothetical protein
MQSTFMSSMRLSQRGRLDLVSHLMMALSPSMIRGLYDWFYLKNIVGLFL